MQAGVAQLVEYELPKLGVAGSNPVARSSRPSPAPTNGSTREDGMGIFGKTDDKPGQGAPRASVPAPSVAPAPAPARAPQAASSGSPCIIGAKTQIKGEITGSENLVVEGLVEGTIRITGDLRVAPGGVVKATVSAQSVLVAGELVGDCHASQRTEIQASGRLTGNIRAPRVVIVEGATFRGNSDMSPGQGEKG
jgi:cytoskeletal protein CcmA (bactofilin family)